MLFGVLFLTKSFVRINLLLKGLPFGLVDRLSLLTHRTCRAVGQHYRDANVLIRRFAFTRYVAGYSFARTHVSNCHRRTGYLGMLARPRYSHKCLHQHALSAEDVHSLYISKSLASVTGMLAMVFILIGLFFFIALCFCRYSPCLRVWRFRYGMVDQGNGGSHSWSAVSYSFVDSLYSCV